MTKEERENAIRCLKLWIEREPQLQTYKTCLEALEQQSKTEYCKDCKYFEYDSVVKMDGIPLIIAHEFCKRWGNGCKTREDGYCFLFEPQERSEQND